MMLRLIGLTGAAGCGKDTLAAHLQNEHPDYFVYAFASPIKQMINELLQVPMVQWNDRKWKEEVVQWLGKSPRVLAQTLGTEWGRNCINSDIWLLAAAKAYTDAGMDGGMIITDVRFDNEADWIHERGGVVVKIDRPGVGTVAAHSSENGLRADKIDATVVNDESVGVLCSRGYMAINSLGL